MTLAPSSSQACINKCLRGFAITLELPDLLLIVIAINQKIVQYCIPVELVRSPPIYLYDVSLDLMVTLFAIFVMQYNQADSSALGIMEREAYIVMVTDC